ncbi:MAG: hypothetical protein EB101_08065 [Chitinophagia bacterium]|nr:hypothetical protein [Chitinophagia bacterium]
MKTKRGIRKPAAGTASQIAAATAWAKANPHEWDFSRVKSEERPMAVAWEYGREKYNEFLNFRSFLLLRDKRRLKSLKKPHETLHGNGLGHIFLTFWKSPHWPSRPYLDLSPKERRQAFPKVFHRDLKTTSADVLELVKDVTPRAPYLPAAWKDFHKAFDPEDYILQEIENPAKRLFLVELNQSPEAILKAFKDHLYRGGLKQGRGRSTLEKDLLALTVHRLHKRYRDFRAMDNVLESKFSGGNSVLASAHNRLPYWNYAQARLGLGWGRKGGKSKNSKPLFQFSRWDVDYD